MPSDVGTYVTNYSDASGHTGIILSEGVTISAGWDKIEVNDSNFRNKNKTANNSDHNFTVCRRYRHKEIK